MLVSLRSFSIKEAAYTLIAVLVVPLSFFLLLEASLRWLNIGQDFGYFRHIEIEGEPFLQENPVFAHQFYAPELNIGPLYNTFAANPNVDDLRVYLLGGSAAMGFPHRNHGLDRLLATRLKVALPNKQIEVINTAMTAVNSHVIYEVAKAIPESPGQFAVILLGNNEVVGPYGPGTFNQTALTSMTSIRTVQAMKRTRIWQLIAGAVARLSASQARDALEWQGMAMFTEQLVQRDDPRLQAVYGHFETNLVDTIGLLRAKGIHVLLATVPVNLRDQAPFASIHDRPLQSPDQLEWQAAVQRGAKAQADSDWQLAEIAYREALALSPDYAETHFQLAQVIEAQARLDQAKNHYRLARDLDALRFRADSTINQVIREVADQFSQDGVTLIDAAEAFESESLPHQPGWNLLLEHVHYDFSGNAVLANAFGNAILDRLDVSASSDHLDSEQLASLVGFPNYETLENLKMVAALANKPPFTGQSNYEDLKQFLLSRAGELETELGTLKTLIQKRRTVLDSPAIDWRFFFEVAVLAERQGNAKVARRFFEQAIDRYPHNRETQMNLARLLSAESEWEMAKAYLERSLHYTRGDRSQIAETLGWLGSVHLQLGEMARGKARLEQVVDQYQDQIDDVLRAYATLVRAARAANDQKAVARYIEETLKYADGLLQRGQDGGYPRLSMRVAQILRLGGEPEAADAWYPAG